MLILGKLIATLTFPGVVLQAVIRGSLLKGKKEADNFRELFLVVIMPLLINSILAFLVGMIYVPIGKYGKEGGILLGLLSAFIVWLGISLGMHAFPIRTDAKRFWKLSNESLKNGNLLAMIGYPIAIIVYIANLLRIIWFDAMYGILITGLSWKLFGLI